MTQTNQIIYYNNANNATLVNIVKEKQKFPINAGMPYGTNVKFSGIKKVGYRIVEFTYHLLSDGDKVLIGQKEIKRVFTV
jgi:hypothetical protein